ncbi:sigma-70 family RNA polymerase sigma factor [Bacillus sp. EB106-08-02-XG196]|uniref:sigma-70 family RNA polymerase sigma factor n=1 Tax=Bacillus sp. EB106-08-02-XG196 TaxID=2737049 RepID=UPI0015C426F8|nr:sigma-70 family RNA polymerase sigma factor [Bacillus sp. EB106-08-02-XG196]NWQ44079.1 sigma-70 family RNA polymerase sigma factor [Bacillus sp. EB106-08-02-XG196]
MIPAKIDPTSITAIGIKSVESIVDWFDLNKQSFYTLGWSYLGNQQQMEELFYQVILKVHKESPRFKRETSFESWVTSIFIHICRELSADRSLLNRVEGETRQDIFKALDQLKEDEKDAMVLTYVKGISKEEGAHLLQVSVEKMKELLFSGIQSLRKGMGEGTNYNGCKEYQKDYIDYLERNLDRPKKIDLEEHIYHCPDCQADLATFQDVMLTLVNLTDRMEDLHVPSGFMENIKDRLAEKEKHRQQKNKKRLRKGLVFAGIFAILLGIEFFTGAFSKSYYTWTEEDQELRAFLQQDLGESLNLEAESNGVKIRIKSAIADEVQTLVFYEIEDTEEDNQYFMDVYEGVFVENDYEIMNTSAYPRYYPPVLEGDVNIEEKNVYQGKIGLQPLTEDNGTIKLKITKLLKLVRDTSDQNGFVAGGMVSETGEWNFEIPVTKQPSVEYALDEETIVEGIPVRFDKLTIAPTATVLQYGVNIEQREKRLDVINFNNLEVNHKKVKADRYSSSFLEGSYEANWIPMQTHFESLFGEKPKEINVQFESIYFTIEDPQTIELDASHEYPQTFEYAGSTMSIDKVEVGQPTKVVISNHENRTYEYLNFQVVGEDVSEIVSLEMDSEGVLVDKNGVEYNMNEPISYEKIEQPRHFITVISAKLRHNNPEEKVIPKKLEIYGYNAMKYLNDVVKISLE